MGIIVTYNNKCRLFTSSNISRANSSDLEPSIGLLTFESSSSFEPKIGFRHIDILKNRKIVYVCPSKNEGPNKTTSKKVLSDITSRNRSSVCWQNLSATHRSQANRLTTHDGIGRIGIWYCGKWINALWLISNRRIFSQGAISSLPKHQIHFHIMVFLSCSSDFHGFVAIS